MEKFVRLSDVEEMLDNARLVTDETCLQGYCTRDVKVDKLPVADVALIVHAHWIEQFEGTYLRRAMYCSACKKKSGLGGSEANQMKPYCPNCGAKMDEGVE